MDAGDWDERYAASELVWSAEPNRWVVEELSDLPPGHAVDLATGEGRNALWLAARGWRVTAVDFSAAGLDKARRLQARHPDSGRLDITWVHADVLTVGPPASPYDLVLVSYLHLPPEQRRTVLRQAAAGLAPGGTLLVIGHDSSNLTDGVGGPQDPRILFTADDVRADLSGLPGLQVERGQRVDRPVTVDGVQRAARDVLVRVRRTG